MKRCLGCKLEKELIEFNYKNKDKDKRQAQCRVCTRKQVQRHYYAHRDYYLKKTAKRNSITRKKVKDYLWDYLSTHPCVDCGEKDVVVLEFDHIHSKKFNISEMITGRIVLRKIIEEIEKCEIRCANCHRRKTAKQFNWKKQAPIAQ